MKKHAIAALAGILLSSTPLPVHSAGASQSDQDFLDSLAIPDSGVLNGLFGKFIRLDHGNFTAVYKFAPDNTVAVTIGPPNADQVSGTWRMDGNQTCMTIGGPQEFCGIIEIKGGTVVFTGPDGKARQAETYELEPPPLLAVNSTPPDQALCTTVTAIVEDEPYQFESLIDDSREQGQVGPLLPPFWYGKLGLWDDDCRVEKSAASGSAVYNCQRVFDKSETKAASAFYQANLQQIELCLKNRTMQADHDYAFKSELANSMIGKGRATVLKLNGGTNVHVSQDVTSVCRGDSYFDCDQVYGVWFSVTADLLAERP